MLCNVLGHMHYWNWASPCVSPCFGNAYGLKCYPNKNMF